MSNTLTKQLTRELKGHPVKAALLGLLAVVALWFWAPLVVDTLRGSQDEDGQPTGSELLANPATQANVTQGDTPAQTAVLNYTAWNNLVSAIETDALTRPLEELDAFRDPFVVPVAISNVADADDSDVDESGFGALLPPGAPELNANQTQTASLGMVLTGTAVGAKARSAVINGRPYREGDIVESPAGMECEVIQIEAKAVVLSAGERVWRLQVDQQQEQGEGARGQLILRSATN